MFIDLYDSPVFRILKRRNNEERGKPGESIYSKMGQRRHSRLIASVVAERSYSKKEKRLWNLTS